MVRSGAIEDYTYLWWDVRPHPRLGTVETRIFDQATRLEDTAAFAALTVSLAHRFATLFDEGEPLVEQPWELIDDNKVRACIRGMEGELVDFNRERPVPAVEMAEGLLSRDRGEREGARLPRGARPGARDPHRRNRLPAPDRLDRGARWRGPARPRRGGRRAHRSPRLLGAARHGAGPPAPGAILVGVPAPELSVVCKSCGSEVSPYVTECPYCGHRLRKRAPKLEREGDEIRVHESRRDKRKRMRNERAAKPGRDRPRRPPDRHRHHDPDRRDPHRPQPGGSASPRRGRRDRRARRLGDLALRDLAVRLRRRRRLHRHRARHRRLRLLDRDPPRVVRDGDADPRHRHPRDAGRRSGLLRRAHRRPALRRRQRRRARPARRLADALARARPRRTSASRSTPIGVGVAAAVLLLLPLVEVGADPIAGLVGGLVGLGMGSLAARRGATDGG